MMPMAIDSGNHFIMYSWKSTVKIDLRAEPNLDDPRMSGAIARCIRELSIDIMEKGERVLRSVHRFGDLKKHL
ncbi:MAG: hypothetical protein PWQ62_172 [Candidatus Methanomethylophilaceae archaeon]|nr:hypothetical protein [Candidatus Methanomethylophilaceae archaeon]